MTKKWYASKTIWIALCECVVGGVFAALESGDNTAGYILIGAGVVQTVIRLITGQPIGK